MLNPKIINRKPNYMFAYMKKLNCKAESLLSQLEAWKESYHHIVDINTISSEMLTPISVQCFEGVTLTLCNMVGRFPGGTALLSRGLGASTSGGSSTTRFLFLLGGSRGGFGTSWYHTDKIVSGVCV